MSHKKAKFLRKVVRGGGLDPRDRAGGLVGEARPWYLKPASLSLPAGCGRHIYQAIKKTEAGR